MQLYEIEFDGCDYIADRFGGLVDKYADLGNLWR